MTLFCMLGGVALKFQEEQAVSELGHTPIPSCQLGQSSDQVELNREGW